MADVDNYLELYKTQLSRFSQTQNIQWRVNYGLWSLIVVGGAFLVRQNHEFDIILACFIAFFIFLLHLVWSYRVQDSLNIDKKLFVAYRIKVEESMNDDTSSKILNAHKAERNEFLLGTTIWIIVQVSFTFILMLSIIVILHSSSDPNSVLPSIINQFY